ncbi:hypothetical protein [Actinomadura logoneensis]|uniref:hypothetical protein n=1 Tax=Actinomadura logoneensis TaxID=2293572 RepID=UPI0011C1A749|nr:hypothetical protein [Actinomadura logoneensis]
MMRSWMRDVREAIDAGRPQDAYRALEEAAEAYPEAARELGHTLLQVSRLDGVGGEEPETERWLRRAVSAMPEGPEAAILLATWLAERAKRLRAMPEPDEGEDPARLAAEARDLYRTALRLRPGSAAAASGLALLLSETAVHGEDEPVIRDWETGRFDYFVIEVEVAVTPQGETASGLAVLRGLDQWPVRSRATARTPRRRRRRCRRFRSSRPAGRRRSPCGRTASRPAP